MSQSGDGIGEKKGKGCEKKERKKDRSRDWYGGGFGREVRVSVSVRASLAATNIQAWSGYYSTKVSRLWGRLLLGPCRSFPLPAMTHESWGGIKYERERDGKKKQRLIGTGRETRAWLLVRFDSMPGAN